MGCVGQAARVNTAATAATSGRLVPASQRRRTELVPLAVPEFTVGFWSVDCTDNSRQMMARKVVAPTRQVNAFRSKFTSIYKALRLP